MPVTNDIETLLPHRKPFLFVDEIVSCDDEGSVSTRKFTDEDFFFKGHFPQYPVVPGVILIETMAQAGGAALSYQKKFKDGSLFFLGTVDKVKFRSQVRPGDTVRLEIKNLRVSPRMVKQSGKAYVVGECPPEGSAYRTMGDTLAAEAEWMCLVGSAQ